MSEKEKRGFFEAIFGKKASSGGMPGNFSQGLSLSWDLTLAPFAGNAWDIATVRAAADAFARNAAKVQPRHIRRTDGSRKDAENGLNRLLQFKPNPYMTAYAFYYRVAVQYCIENNAFILPVRDNGVITALYPLSASRIEIIKSGGGMYARITYPSGERASVPYEEIIHIRRHYKENELFGDSNNALQPILGTAKAFNQSMGKYAKLVSVVRGILKFVHGSKDDDLAALREKFIKENFHIDKDGAGIIVTDSKHDYIPLKEKEIPIPKGQLEYVKQEIYDYIGVNEAIVQNKADSEQMDAFYRGTLSPFYMQLSQGLTNGLFSDRERAYGNEILCELDRLQFATLTSRVSAAQFLTSVGAASLDQILDIFGMPPIGGEEGARRVQTLNMVNSEIIDAYQMLRVGEDQDNNGGNPQQNKEEENA